MAKDASETTAPGPLRRLLRRLIHAPAAVSILWPALLFCGSYLAWHRWGADRVASELYGLDRTAIRLTETPPYVQQDIVEAVYRDTALGELSLLDPQATARVASAFSMHPWIREVISVRKLPGGQIDVHAEFRVPVAMVRVPYDGGGVSGERPRFGFYPVDAEGTMLPTADFSRAQTRDYIHIIVPGATPAAGVLGSPFGDRRVEHAARLAAALADFRESAQIESITARGELRGDEVPQFELTTFDGKRPFWGSPPGLERPGEPPAEMKLRALLQGVAADTDLRMAQRQPARREGG